MVTQLSKPVGIAMQVIERRQITAFDDGLADECRWKTACIRAAAVKRG